jgi:hypothetical protein
VSDDRRRHTRAVEFRKATPWCVLVLLFVLPSRADAHRLDEYLQAVRVSVTADRVRVEIDLSPGVDVADAIIRTIDADGDGAIAEREASAYASRVLGATTLSVDGRPAVLTPDGRRFPSIDDMRLGLGTIRLTTSAWIAATPGRHRLAFANAYLPGISVYLVNALVSSDQRITLLEQHRDPLQRTYALDYDVAGGRAWLAWSAAMAAMMGLLMVGRTRSGRTSAGRHPPPPLSLR